MNPLTKILNGFHSAPSSSRSAAKRTSVRLGVETLEDRMMPSASSFNLHAVLQPNGGSAAFFRSPVNDAFYEKTPSGSLVQISGSHTVKDFSAGLDVNGNADVFARQAPIYSGAGTVYSLFEHDPAGWHKLNEPITMLNFAAVKGGRCYSIGSDHSLWEYTPSFTTTIYYRNIPLKYTVPARWTELWGANAVWGIDAVTQKSGIDAVFCEGGDGRLEMYSQGNWQMLAAGDANGNPVFNSFSAGLDLNGYANVWMVTNGNWSGDHDGNPSLAVWDSVWTSKQDDPLLTISATTDGQVFVLHPEGALFEVSEYTMDGPLVPGSQGIGTITDIAAAGSNDAFVVTAGGYLKEHTTAGWFSYN
jgi:hypothetical protein